MDWALRIRKDVPSWVVTLVLIVAIPLIGGLHYFSVLWRQSSPKTELSALTSERAGRVPRRS